MQDALDEHAASPQLVSAAAGAAWRTPPTYSRGPTRPDACRPAGSSLASRPPLSEACTDAHGYITSSMHQIFMPAPAAVAAMPRPPLSERGTHWMISTAVCFRARLTSPHLLPLPAATAGRPSTSSKTTSIHHQDGVISGIQGSAACPHCWQCWCWQPPCPHQRHTAAAAAHVASADTAATAPPRPAATRTSPRP